MYGLFNRVARVFSANAHQAVDRTEQPEAMLNQLQREMVQACTRASVALQQAIAWRRQIEQRLERARHEGEEAKEAAREAVARGDDSLARAAIARRQARESEAEALGRQLDQADGVVARQRERQRNLREELRRLREKRAVLIQRSRFARSLRDLGAGIEAMPEPVAEVVQRMEEKVSAEEALADAVTECATETDPGPDVDAFLRNQKIDAELERMKSELRSTPTGENR